ncbi:hypothetical protein AX16_000198 [Volvariella volvacea WC 439]|nr:hypothetical protein AX16_000198 [Volvariella volvacea WC 439]
MTTSANYRAALLAMEKATVAFADAMYKCSGLKGPSYEAGSRLQAASGLHHLIGNHWHLLAEVIDKNFERPLRQHLDAYRTVVQERSASYERALREKSQVIRTTEMRNLNTKQRNLQSFREALAVLQRQVDELDDLKSAHYQEIVEHEDEVWEVVQGKVCVVVRSTMDVFDRFTAKASDPIIEPMLQSVPDPFDSYGPPQAEDQIFSILAPLSIMPTVPSSSPTPLTATPAHDTMNTLPTLSSKNNSWLPGTNAGTIFPAESTDWASISPPSSSPTLSASPPPPSHRRHTVPISTTGQHRKAESKLRSVLAVIDEGHPRHEPSPDHSPQAPTVTNANGLTSSPYAENTIASSPPTTESHDDNDHESLTPRHSDFHVGSPLMPPDIDTPPKNDIDESTRVVSFPT